MNIVVNELMASYRLAGKGRLVLLLHGWGDNKESLAELFDALSRRYQVLSVDLPGFGATQAPKEIWDLDDYANFVDSLINKLELSQPYAIIGHSNGGALAIRGIGTGQLEAEKLVLLASSGIRIGQSAKRLILNIIAKVGNVATIWMPERYRRALRKSLYGAAGSDMLVAPHLQETFKVTVRQDVQADAAKIGVPTLLVYAADDTAVPVSDGERFHELIKGSSLKIIQDASHFLHQEKPEAVAELIEDFLK